jgi:hypothetical protein
MAEHSHHYHHKNFPDWWELAEIPGEVSEQSMPLRHGWGLIICQTVQANRGCAAVASFFGGEGGLLTKKGVTLRGLRISEKKEILRKPTVL